MNMKKTILALLMALMMLVSGALAEQTGKVAAIVNGENIMQSDVDAQVQYMLQMYANYGMDTTDPSLQNYVANLALASVIDDCLLTQDMTAKGAFDFTEEEIAEIESKAQSSYSMIIAQAAMSYVSTMGEDAALVQAEAAANAYGYTAEYFISYYQNDMASQKYADALMADEEITDEMIQNAYAAHVTEDQQKYANDIAAFEEAMMNTGVVWYIPEGYRRVMMLMVTDGTENEAIKRLEAGESFADLMAAYGQLDTSAGDDSMGYMFHRDSKMMDATLMAAAFSEELQKPGDFLHTPVISGGTKFVVGYIGDRKAGPVPYTAEVKEALRQECYDTRSNEKVNERMLELEETADIQLMLTIQAE